MAPRAYTYDDDGNRINKHEVFADVERCSHCGRALLQGGSVNGAGRYCRTCIRRHTNERGPDARWITIRTCRHCMTAGVLPGFLQVA